MTLPYERTLAIIETEKFLRRLCDAKVTPNTPKIIRDQAKALLRHYPQRSDLALIATGWNEKLVTFTFECPISHPDNR